MPTKASTQTQPLLKLPTGIQTFEKLREGGYVYIDKTAYLLRLIDTGSVYFLSRPRRFGKSLTVSTFDALFSGKKHLFDGSNGTTRLAAAEYFERDGYRPYPVVHIDMSQTITDSGVQELKHSMLEQVKQNQRRYELEEFFDEKEPAIALKRLLEELNRRVGPVVVLIDEYDKPILDTLGNPEKAKDFRAVLRGFYTQIKAEDASTKFVFVTGISKFTKTGVFSAMNNLTDISLDDEYASMVGITEGELLEYFDGYIERATDKLGLSREALLERIKEYYDGFSFNGVDRLYNPFSMLSFFGKNRFQDFWFSSGSPSFLIDYIKKYGLAAEEYRGKLETYDFTEVAEIEYAKPSSFLFQAGYLTVREIRDNLLVLDYPNLEVLSAMSKLFLMDSTRNPDVGLSAQTLQNALAKGEAEAIVRYYNQTLAAIPYDIYAREEADYAKYEAENPYNNRAESFFHAVLFTLLWASGVVTLAETHSYHGKSDIEILHRGHVYVVELKIADSAAESETKADEALAQIYEKGYADKWPKAALLGLAVDRSTRRVGAWRMGRP